MGHLRAWFVAEKLGRLCDHCASVAVADQHDPAADGERGIRDALCITVEIREREWRRAVARQVDCM